MFGFKSDNYTINRAFLLLLVKTEKMTLNDRQDYFLTMTAFIQDHYTIVLALHLLAMAVGIGGATVSDILFFKFLKDYRISKKEAEVLHVLKDVILSAMLLIAVSGIALFIGKPELGSSGPFLVKTIAATVLIINGICLHAFIAPHLIHLDLKGSQKMSRVWHRLAFALGAISLCSWYSVFLLASLKSMLPQDFSALLKIYLLVLTSGVIGSQVF